MSTVTIIIQLVDNKELKVTGPLEHQSDLCARMLREAVKVAESYEPKLVVVGDSLFTGLSPEHSNYQVRKIL